MACMTAIITASAAAAATGSSHGRGSGRVGTASINMGGSVRTTLLGSSNFGRGTARGITIPADVGHRGAITRTKVRDGALLRALALACALLISRKRYTTGLSAGSLLER